MGCSPSKGKLFSKPEGPAPQNGLLAKAAKNDVDSRPLGEDNNCLETADKENELPQPPEEHSTKETALSQVAADSKSAEPAEDFQEMKVDVMPQETVDEVVKTGKVKKTEKRKKNKDKRRATEKHRKSSVIQKKVDFPPHMVRAHQAAYAFLNPNISKYETLLGLLDQAAQTQLSLQPMMSALVLRFEEINQALEEMAEEGEMMLKEHGDYMALPSGMMGPAVLPAKPSTDSANRTDPPPDLLQQLLQHSTEKMRLVGSSVQALGDSTLKDTVEYFSSLSKLLSEKRHSKQAAEQRLTQVLARVEVAAVRGSNPEDSALHSEDSGIGGENESLTGSERHRRHRGSAGSGSCGSGANIRGALDTLHNNLVGHNEDDEEEEDEEEDDDEDYEDMDEEEDRVGRKRSNSSPPDPSNPLFYMCAKRMQDLQPAVKRPLTAVVTATPEPFSSARCVNIVMDLQKSQRDLDQRMKRMAETSGQKESTGPHYNIYKAGLRRHSLSGSGGALRGKAHKSPESLPMLAPHPPKRNSVRRLINTFSQGVDGRPGQSLANVPPHIQRPRKSGVIILSDVRKTSDGVLVINGNNNNNSWPDSKDDLDVDSLPPPPPEVLMDNSFQSTERMLGSDESDPVQSLPMINQKTAVSQRLKACMQNVDVLPNRASVRPKSVSSSRAHPLRQDAVMGVQDAEQQADTDVDPEMEKANSLYQQARKIIHLRSAAESSDKRHNPDQGSRAPSPFQARADQSFDSNDPYEGETSSLPVIAPPVSRVRLPPSCPSVRHRFPSPPVFRPSSRPSSPRTVTRATENHTEEIIPSVSFHDARSVFCQRPEQNAQNWTSSGGSVLPRPGGDASRGRLATRGGDNGARRTQSEQRPRLTSYYKDGSSTSTQAMEREPGIAKHRLSGPVMTEDDAQLDPSATAMTA